MRGLALAAALAAVLALPAAAQARGCTSGKIHIGKGVGKLRLGNTRAQVTAQLGTPYYENANGYMQYAPDSFAGLCDVYRASGSHSSRIRMFGVSGSKFVLSNGIHIFAAGGLRKLADKFGSRLKYEPTEDGEPQYVIHSHYNGRAVLTSFTPSRHSLNARVSDVFILYG